MADVETEKPGTAEIEMPYDSESFQPPVMSMPAVTKPCSLTMMAMAVQYMVNRKEGVEMLIDKKKMPCGVVWAGLY